jgi:hypothetical protein
VLDWNLRCTDDTIQGMMTRSLNDACETHATGAVMIMKDASSVLKGLVQRHFEASCVTLISQSICMH